MHEKQHNDHLKDLKASDIQDADERSPLTFGPVQGFVDAVNQPAEEALVGRLGEGLNGEISLDEKKNNNTKKGMNEATETSLLKYREPSRTH